MQVIVIAAFVGAPPAQLLRMLPVFHREAPAAAAAPEIAALHCHDPTEGWLIDFDFGGTENKRC